MERHLLPDKTRVDGFREFVEAHERKLRHALTAALGYDFGKDAAAEALAYGWEHWERVRDMENPIGYLYVVGRAKGRRMSRFGPITYPPVTEERTPWCEPGLPAALAGLPEKQRIVVLLVYGYDWRLSEVAQTLGVSKSTVQTHADRAMSHLRRKLGANR
jgi:DNA-directed RNA polymerase specialized sigma24 family protein